MDSKWTQLDKFSPKLHPNGSKWIKMVTNGFKWTQMDTNGPKCAQMDSNGPKWTQIDSHGKDLIVTLIHTYVKDLIVRFICEGSYWEGHM